MSSFTPSAVSLSLPPGPRPLFQVDHLSLNRCSCPQPIFPPFFEPSCQCDTRPIRPPLPPPSQRFRVVLPCPSDSSFSPTPPSLFGSPPPQLSWPQRTIPWTFHPLLSPDLLMPAPPIYFGNTMAVTRALLFSVFPGSIRLQRLTFVVSPVPSSLSSRHLARDKCGPHEAVRGAPFVPRFPPQSSTSSSVDLPILSLFSV